jgi:hypothetical protein
VVAVITDAAIFSRHRRKARFEPGSFSESFSAKTWQTRSRIQFIVSATAQSLQPLAVTDLLIESAAIVALEVTGLLETKCS